MTFSIRSISVVLAGFALLLPGCDLFGRMQYFYKTYSSTDPRIAEFFARRNERWKNVKTLRAEFAISMVDLAWGETNRLTATASYVFPQVGSYETHGEGSARVVVSRENELWWLRNDHKAAVVWPLPNQKAKRPIAALTPYLPPWIIWLMPSEERWLERLHDLRIVQETKDSIRLKGRCGAGLDDIQEDWEIEVAIDKRSFCPTAMTLNDTTKSQRSTVEFKSIQVDGATPVNAYIVEPLPPSWTIHRVKSSK